MPNFATIINNVEQKEDGNRKHLIAPLAGE
jgi:hypothetical protein